MGGVGTECWAILQSDISFAINPIWIDFPPSHTLRNSSQMLFFAAAAAASLTRHREEQKETQRGDTEREIMEFSISLIAILGLQ